MPSLLIIDDNQADADLYKEWLRLCLEKNALKFLNCSNISDGLASFEAHDPKCVLLDYQMAKGDGIDFLKLLEEKVGRAVPVIFMTAYGDEEVAQECLIHGAQHFLPKQGLNEEILCKKVQDVLELNDTDLLDVNNAIQQHLQKISTQ